LGPLIVLVAMFALLWVFLIMPQRRRAQAQRELIASVEIGDEILTVGGLIGRVRSAQDEELVLEIAPETQVRVARRSVAGVLAAERESKQVEATAAPEQDEEVRS
jgi:preprotein translocase subunit YajC